MEPRLLLDEMLGSLARWLRMAGYDVLYAGEIEGGDEGILRRAGEEGRTVVTRDVELVERYGDSVLLRSRELEEQIATVASELGLELEASMERCPLCNSALEEAASADEDYVPEGAEDLHSCTGCGQFFWKGSHWEEITDRMEEARKDCRDR